MALAAVYYPIPAFPAKLEETILQQNPLNMKANCYLYLHTRWPKANGTCPIVIIITFRRSSIQMATGISVLPKDWDSRARIVLPSYRGTESVARVNTYLSKRRNEISDIILKLEEQGKLKNMPRHELKQRLERKDNAHSIVAFTEQVIKTMLVANQIGTSRIYRTTLNLIRSHGGGGDLLFTDINLAFIESFVAAHLGAGNTHNAISVYLRTLRAIFNKAIKLGIIERELYPFANYRIRETKTRKRSLTYEAIQKIVNANLENDSTLELSRDLFMFSFMARGMPFVDMAHLRCSDIVDGRLAYKRQKTEQHIDMRMSERMKDIVAAYAAGKRNNEYVFPLLTTAEPIKQYEQLLKSRKKHNKALKKIAAKVGLEVSLSSYVSRHSFAQRLKELGIPISEIADLMAHDNISTTQIYLDGLGNAKMDDITEEATKL
ncbi:MAG: site-specific integrase [Bacteroidetes bacterium]|nr:site-specific integrase [Bacteroidota bacterium]